MSESLNLGAIRSQAEIYLLNTSTDTASLSWSIAELNSYINEGVLYTQMMTEWFEEFDNLLCTASVSTYTANPRVHQFQRFTFDAQFMPQTNEYELDRDDPSWRSARPNTPFRFYFPQFGQQPLIVPYPTPKDNGVGYICSLELGAVAGMGTEGSFVVSDNFIRSALGPNYTPVSVGPAGPSFQIVSNQIVCESATSDPNDFLLYNVAPSADQYAEITLAFDFGNNFSSLGPLVRGSSLGCYSLLIGGTGIVTLNRVASGVVTNLGTAFGVAISGDTWKLSITGSTLNVYRNGTLYAPFSGIVDTTFATGQPGICGSGYLPGTLPNAVYGTFWQAQVFGLSEAPSVPDPNITFSQETGIVIEDQDPNRSLVLFQVDLPTNPFLSTSREYGELIVYSTDENNIGTSYVRLPDTLVLDTDTPQLPVQTHLGLVMYTMMKCFAREGEFQDLALAKSWFDAYADWMESVLENKARWFSTRVRSLEPYENGSLFLKRLNALGYPMQMDLQPSYT